MAAVLCALARHYQTGDIEPLSCGGVVIVGTEEELRAAAPSLVLSTTTPPSGRPTMTVSEWLTSSRPAEPPSTKGNPMTYDRNARRLADNQHGNTPTGDYTPGDDVSIAVYPDPKARHLYGETETLQGKRATRAAADAANEPAPKTTKK